MKRLYLRYKELILYLLFGGLTTAVNYIVYILAAWVIGLSASIATAAAWFFAVAFAFVTNKILVFESKKVNKKILAKELLMFMAARIFSGAVTVGVMFVFVDLMQFNDILILTVMQIFVIIFNYAVSKWVIFKK